jgi:hypothetical protein
MLTFDAENLFPLLPMKDHHYRESQEHAAHVDAALGINVAAVEKSISKALKDGRLSLHGKEGEIQEAWVDLAIQTLLTPYTEIRSMLDQLKLPPGSTIVDLGAGYGRMGFVVGRHYPEWNFIGYEFLKERVEEGVRCLKNFSYKNVSLLHADLSDCDFSPARAEAYFIYDFGNRNAIEKVLFDLQFISKETPIIVVGRGRSTRDAIERRHFWLTDIVPPEHYAHYSLYRSAEIRKS